MAIKLSSEAASFLILSLQPEEQHRKVFHQLNLGALTWHVQVAG
jgi:hypothetical protein